MTVAVTRTYTAEVEEEEEGLDPSVAADIIQH